MKHGYHVMLTVSRENPDIEKENIMTLLSHRVDGLLVAVSKDTKDATVFETVKKMNIPLVFFDRTIEEIRCSSVSINDRKAAAELVEYAIACGYKNIAHLAGSSTIAIGRDRRAGYEETLKWHNIPVREEWIVEGGFDKTSGYNGFHTLQEQAELPEVIFAANDRIAQGAYEAIKEAGLKIPEDIGVIALGHNEFAEILSPSLTIMDAPPDVIGQRAMEILAEEMKDPSKCGQHHIVLETSMKIHSSIGNK